MLNFKEIKEKYPKSYKLLVDWTKGTLLSFQKMFMGTDYKGELPEITDEMAEKGLEGFIKINYRLLYDFFDRNDVVLSIQLEFQHGLFAFSSNLDTKVHNTRMEAEKVGFEKAFETLESKS